MNSSVYYRHFVYMLMSIHGIMNDLISTLTSLDINEMDVTLFDYRIVICQHSIVDSDADDGKFGLNLYCLVYVSRYIHSTVLSGHRTLLMAYRSLVEC